MKFNDIDIIDDSFDITDGESLIVLKKKKEKSKYRFNKKRIKYDSRTMEWYKNLRELKLDPILFDEVNEKLAFKFCDRWDPYTGERIDKDPYGSLYFNPVNLVYYFYSNRLNKLWKFNNDGYQGYYDDGVGAGELFNIKGRGDHPEWYLFRLPITDCYLTKSHRESFITMGPKLTDNEIKEIDNLMKKKELKDQYKKYYGRNPPSLKKIKDLYDLAISKDLDINKSDLSSDEINNIRYKKNIEAVNSLINKKI